MAFDGSIVACITDELSRLLTGGRVFKIVQPEKDELLLTIKKERDTRKLLISVDPTLPMIYLTDENKTAPMTAPAFCMLLRKHLQNGMILSVTQPSLERIIRLEVEHYNEMGDLCRKTLVIELMGKYSNIIFCEGDKILDSIKHVSAFVSSVREVLPGRSYFIPFEGQKLNPLDYSKDDLKNAVFQGSDPLAKSLYQNVTGISPVLAQEIIYRSGLDSDRAANSFENSETEAFLAAFEEVISLIREKQFAPNIIYKGEEPVLYAPFSFRLYDSDSEGYSAEYYESVSALLYDFYAKRQRYTNIRQKTADLRQIVSGILAKDYKKYDLQLKQMKDTGKRDQYQLYGELATSYGYSVPANATSMTAVNYHTGEEITIPLDPSRSAVENGKHFFEKYAKMKRTYEALVKVAADTGAEIEHLESISASLDTVQDAADIAELKKEMEDNGYIKSHAANTGGKRKQGKLPKSSPLHYISSDGFHIYVGKNNYQNEMITFQMADGGDWWFHAKKLPGSHVIVKTEGRELPDRTFEEAASLAAHYSKAEGADKVEIDYVKRKEVKKPAGAKPGFVIYHTNFSMMASTDISGIQCFQP